MSLPAQSGIIGLQFLSIGAGRNDRTHPLVQGVLSKPLGVISLVGNHLLPGIIGYQTLGLSDVVLLPPVWMNRRGLPKTSKVT